MAVKPEPVEACVPPASSSDFLKSTLRKAPPAPVVDDSKEAQSKARKAMWDYRKATAWPVYRWPIERRRVEEHIKVHLPRGYLARGGEEVKTVWAGNDLNQFVHAHYLRAVEPVKVEGEEDMEQGEEVKGANYVTGEVVHSKKYVAA